MQDYSDSIANTLELLQSRTKPLKCKVYPVANPYLQAMILYTPYACNIVLQWGNHRQQSSTYPDHRKPIW